MRRKKNLLSIGVMGCLMFGAVHLLFFAGTARSEFPDKPITALVSFGAGSTTDILARALGIGAEKALNTKLVFENRCNQRKKPSRLV